LKIYETVQILWKPKLTIEAPVATTISKIRPGIEVTSSKMSEKTLQIFKLILHRRKMAKLFIQLLILLCSSLLILSQQCDSNGVYKENERPSSCKQILAKYPDPPSGYYWLQSSNHFTSRKVYCDMDNQGWLNSLKIVGAQLTNKIYFYCEKLNSYEHL